jgi:hypothetical protein
MKMTVAMTLVVLLLSATGCVFIPIPTKHYDSGYARTNINQHVQQQFVPGRTTREDIIVALGEPDAVSLDELHLAYRSEKAVALWILAAGGGYSGVLTGGTIYKNRFFVFDFNSQGRFQTARQTGQFGMVQGSHESELRSPVFTAGGSNAVIAMIAGEPVQREYPQSFWLAGSDLAGWKGAGYTVGQPGHLFCTESNLAFATEAQFANTEPILKLPFADIEETHLDKYFRARRLVVHLKNGVVHAFLINKPGIGFQDLQAMQAVRDFIQSKIKMRPTEP